MGRSIDSQIRGAVGSWAGASAEDDWATIGSKSAGKIQRILEDAIPMGKEAESEERSAETADT